MHQLWEIRGFLRACLNMLDACIQVCAHISKDFDWTCVDPGEGETKISKASSRRFAELLWLQPVISCEAVNSCSLTTYLPLRTYRWVGPTVGSDRLDCHGDGLANPSHGTRRGEWVICWQKVVLLIFFNKLGGLDIGNRTCGRR